MYRVALVPATGRMVVLADVGAGELVAAGVRAVVLFARRVAWGLGGDGDGEEEEEEEETRDEPPPSKKQKVEPEQEEDVSLDNTAYLKSKLRYTDATLLDSSDNAVMMDWETQIMQRHATTLVPRPGLRTMNIGHGMGIIDTAFLSHSPSQHHIVEAHPQVLQRLRHHGWYDKPNVVIHEGTWQDVLPQLAAQGVILDAIYYDTFAEGYKAFKEFFSDYVIQLLDPAGRFGWFNGLGADRQLCSDVYTNVRILLPVF